MTNDRLQCGTDNANIGSAVRFPQCAMQKERSAGEKVSILEKVAILDGVRNGLKSIGLSIRVHFGP